MFGKDKEAAKLAAALQLVVREAIEEATKDFQAVKTIADLERERVRLTTELTDLGIKKAKAEEDNARALREVEHKVGLERKRQEFELAAAKRETAVALREEALTQDRKRFDEQLKFHEDRFSTEVTYLKDLLVEIMKRLPDVQVHAEAKVGRKA